MCKTKYILPCDSVILLTMTAGVTDKLTLTRTVPTAFPLLASWHADGRSKHQMTQIIENTLYTVTCI